jgi:Sec-independent protein translocase protein TatA
MKGQMKEAKMHYDALMEVLDTLGMGLEDFQEQMGSMGEEASEMDEYAEESMGEEEEEEEEGQKKPMDKAKVALIVARMKGKMKG